MWVKMSKADENAEKKLGIFYEAQANLLERLRIHQRNLNRLLTQKAKYGIDAPLHILNGIDQEEDEIKNVKKDLENIELEISNFIAESNKNKLKADSSSQKGIKPVISIDGIGYVIDVPFPFLRSETIASPTGQLYGKSYYAGGFEVHSIITPGKPDMDFSFYVHNCKVAPVLDMQNKKLVIPKGHAIAVSSIVADFRNIVTENDIQRERLLEGRWTIISPASPKSMTMVNEWPQGGDDIAMTTKLEFEEGYEFWMVQSLKQYFPLTVWFYEQGLNVLPISNPKLLSLKFPQKS